VVRHRQDWAKVKEVSEEKVMWTSRRLPCRTLSSACRWTR